MKLTFESMRGYIRETLTAVASLIATYQWVGEDQLSYATASTIALATAAWSFFDPAVVGLRASFLRKALQTLPPCLAAFGMVTQDQAAGITGIILAVTAAWSQSNKSEE